MNIRLLQCRLTETLILYFLISFAFRVSNSEFMQRQIFISTCIIYASMFLNNVLLTMVVPILPDLLENEKNIANVQEEKDTNKTYAMELFYKSMKQISALKTEKAAFLLSSKSIIQLAVNPLIAVFVPKMGYNSSLLTGNLILLVTSLAFAFGTGFLILTIARGIHGIASAILTVSGMCLCAENFREDEKLRGKYMGIILGGEALGVLIGYSFGSFTYNIFGQSVSFLLVAYLILTNIGCPVSMYHPYNRGTISVLTTQNDLPYYQLQGLYIEAGPVWPKKHSTLNTSNSPNWVNLLRNPCILLIFGAIFVSSSIVAILEPCLPFWLVHQLKIERWQLGLMFLPDSLGYFISTNMLSVVYHRIGKLETATLALLIIGICSTIIPNATSLLQLSLPHFSIGLGIGAVDLALVPMLANFADLNRNFGYGSVYALQQVINSSAYVFGSFLAGELYHIVGFPTIIRTIGILNIFYSGLITFYSNKHFPLEEEFDDSKKSSREICHQIELISMKNYQNYHSLRTSDDSD